ncbi:MAG: hypothetical protein AAF649_13200, partial [Verrucomicrobiota bacterium]
MCPLKVLFGDGGVVGFVGADTDRCVTEPRKVTVNPPEAIQVSDAWCGAKAGHRHDGSGNVNASDGDGPLHCSDEGLVLLDTFRVKELTDIRLRMVSLLQRQGDVGTWSGTKHLL